MPPYICCPTIHFLSLVLVLLLDRESAVRCLLELSTTALEEQLLSNYCQQSSTHVAQQYRAEYCLHLYTSIATIQAQDRGYPFIMYEIPELYLQQ